MRLFYYHKIFVQCMLQFLKLDDCQQILCVYQLASLLQHTDQEKQENRSQFERRKHSLVIRVILTSCMFLAMDRMDSTQCELQFEKGQRPRGQQAWKEG